MPLAKIHIHEGRYSEERLTSIGHAIQAALEDVLRVPAEDYFRLYFPLPSNRYVHTPGFLGMKYSEDMILIEISFIAGRPRDTRLALLKAINANIVAAVGISPDDVLTMLYETPGENISFGRGEAQRAHIGAAR